MLGFGRSPRLYSLANIILGVVLISICQNLSEADFGNYKLIIGLVAIFIFWIICGVKDFLAVRSLSILLVLCTRGIGFCLVARPARLFLVTITYILIVSALYFGAWPYRFRDFFEWLAENSKDYKYYPFSCRLLV